MESFIEYWPVLVLLALMPLAPRLYDVLEEAPTWIKMSISCAFILGMGYLAYDNGRGPLIAFGTLLAVEVFWWTWGHKRMGQQKIG